MRIVLLILVSASAVSQSLEVIPAMHHVRNGTTPEWANFPATGPSELSINFEVADPSSWQTMIIRQRDVRQDWQIFLNDRAIGKLVNDEKDMLICLTIPPGTLVSGTNALRISTKSSSVDDIRIGECTFEANAIGTLLSSCSLDVSVTENAIAVPARITVLNEKRSMVALSAPEDASHVAARPGCVYTATGHATIGLQPGRYTIFANRGFEYSVDSVQVELKAGSTRSVELSIIREVDTKGWISSDPHVHTFTHSGHGDATDRERMITLAGEGIELPVITDHNKHVDLGPVADAAGVKKWMTTVTGNEVTTPVGHFNVFPVSASGKPVDHRVDNWPTLGTRLKSYGNAVVILNHANDIHNSFRPFDASVHIAPAGRNRKDWIVPANAMEVLNSGSQQSDINELYSDWFGMLNGGHLLTPIGSSDSHDVTRFIVGQGRTYIQGDDTDPSAINVNEAVKSLLAGKVLVSAGLLTMMKVNNKYGPGDLVPGTKTAELEVIVTGPSWAKADQVSLYVNGVLHEQKKISGGKVEKWRGSWTIAVPSHDVFVVAVASGPGTKMDFWPLEKPYQATTPYWEPRVMGITGAVWIDGDGNGERNTASQYATRVMRSTKGIAAMIAALEKYDEAVAIQVAAMLVIAGNDLSSTEVNDALKKASPHVQQAFETVRRP